MSEGWFAQERYIGMKVFAKVSTCILRANFFLRTSSNVIVFVNVVAPFKTGVPNDDFLLNTLNTHFRLPRIL